MVDWVIADIFNSNFKSKCIVIFTLANIPYNHSLLIAHQSKQTLNKLCHPHFTVPVGAKRVKGVYDIKQCDHRVFHTAFIHCSTLIGVGVLATQGSTDTRYAFKKLKFLLHELMLPGMSAV